MHFICYWSCCLLKSTVRAAGAACISQTGFCIWTKAQFCEAHSWLPSSWPWVLYLQQRRVWTDPWWPNFAATTSVPFECLQSKLSKMISPSERSVSPEVVANAELDVSPPHLLSLPRFYWLTHFPLVMLMFYVLTQKLLTSKVWFMTSLKGVIWGFWWKAGKKTKVSLHCQIMQGQKELWSFALFFSSSDKVQAFQPVVKWRGDRIH